MKEFDRREFMKTAGSALVGLWIVTKIPVNLLRDDFVSKFNPLHEYGTAFELIIPHGKTAADVLKSDRGKSVIKMLKRNASNILPAGTPYELRMVNSFYGKVLGICWYYHPSITQKEKRFGKGKLDFRFDQSLGTFVSEQTFYSREGRIDGL